LSGRRRRGTGEGKLIRDGRKRLTKRSFQKKERRGFCQTEHCRKKVLQRGKHAKTRCKRVVLAETETGW